jgi:uncharacterized RDD family membrane protein YckC
MALAPEDRYRSASTLRKALEPFGTVRPLPPAPVAASLSRRIAAGLLDVATVLLFLAALTAERGISLEEVPPIGVVLWWITQLLPLVAGATPGMLVMGLRLTDQRGGAITLRTLLFRTVMLIATIITLRLWPDSQGLFMHDRVSCSRVVFRTK